MKITGKKIISFLIIIIVLVFLFLLIRGGNSTLVTSKRVTESDGVTYDEKNVIEFKKNIATSIETTMTFYNEESANSMYEWLMSLSKNKENEEMKVQKNGNTIVTTNNMKSYVNFKGNFSEDLTKDEIKDWFESQGYTVK